MSKKDYQKNWAKNLGKRRDYWDDKRVKGVDSDLRSTSDNVLQRTAVGYFANLLDFLGIMDRKSDN